MKIIRILAVYLVMAGSVLNISTANAILVFSDVSVTSHSVTFTIDGDMSGYGTIGNVSQFGIQYRGDLWAGNSLPQSNTWSTSVFDTHDFDHAGNTGIWQSEWGYSWARFDSSLATAIATDRTVTLDFTEDLLNPFATAGDLVFVVGSPNSLYPSLTTILGTVSVSSSVPLPSSIVLFAVGLLGLIFARPMVKDRYRSSEALHSI